MKETTPQQQETHYAMGRALFIVLVPGVVFVFGLIYLVMPPRLPLTAINGCYKILSGPRIRLFPPTMQVEGRGQSDRIVSVRYGKPEFEIDVDRGVSFERSGDTIVAQDDRWSNTLIGAAVDRDGRAALQMYIAGGTVEIPRIKC